MISSLFHFALSTICLIIRCIKLFYRLTSATSLGVVLFVVLALIALCRYFRLKQPIDVPKQLIDAICGSESTKVQGHIGDRIIGWWPIANRGACFDGVENSRSAIENCVAQSCGNILLDVDITKCGQLVILHKKTLMRLQQKYLNQNGAATAAAKSMSASPFHGINAINFDDLKAVNIAKNHPLCGKHPNESILHFNDLMKLLNTHDQLNVFLLMGSSSKRITSTILRHLQNNPERVKRIVICSRSPFVIYQLRKRNPSLICALWLDKISDLPLPSVILNSTIFSFLYGLLFRNIVAVMTGISAIFISKHDINAHLCQMWQRAAIRPIVYTLNSPSEKRYFQQTLQTQYLTDSLRSEPHHFVKSPSKVSSSGTGLNDKM